MATPARKSRVRRHPIIVENSDPNVISFTPSPHKRADVSKNCRPNARSAITTTLLGKPIKKSPVSKKSASKTPKYVAANRKRLDSSSKKRSTSAYDAPRAPLRELSEERDKIRAKLSSPMETEQSNSALKMRRMRSVVVEEGMTGLPEPGAGRVMYLVRTFERLLSLSGDSEGEDRVRNNNKKKVMNWELPGLQLQKHLPPSAEETDVSYSPVASSSEIFLPGDDSDTDFSDRCSSAGSNGDSANCTRAGWRRSRCNSIGSSERSWSRKLGVTSQQPFKLKTEQRGKVKEENLIQKVREMLLEEERRRIPLAQGLPWTTDEPENPMKPPTKELAEPVDLVLHSDVRAVERAEFDHRVAARISFLEQVKLEKERQQKMEEEEEIKQLRKGLVPRAQPMPDFGRPFVPERSTRPQTVPKEPRFHPRLSRDNSKS